MRDESERGDRPRLGPAWGPTLSYSPRALTSTKDRLHKAVLGHCLPLYSFLPYGVGHYIGRLGRIPYPDPDLSACLHNLLTNAVRLAPGACRYALESWRASPGWKSSRFQRSHP